MEFGFELEGENNSQWVGKQGGGLVEKDMSDPRPDQGSDNEVHGHICNVNGGFIFLIEMK